MSAEEYRFRDSENGMGIDMLVAMLDNPRMGSLNYGTQMFLCMPKFVPARNLLPLIQNVGMNISDVSELWQGQDLVACDTELNWLAFDVCNYSCGNIAKMLARYDVPIPQAKLRSQIYELTDENDSKIGIDFQNWKNNEGSRLFSAGGRYRNNWDAIYSANPLARTWGSERTSFFNFNPKWNTRYLDFLASRSKAKLLQEIWQHFSRTQGAWQAKLPLLALQAPAESPQRLEFLERCFKPDVAAFSEIYRTVTGFCDPDSAYCCFLSILLPIAVVAGQSNPVLCFSAHCRLSEHFNRIFLNSCRKTLRNLLQLKDSPEKTASSCLIDL